MKYLYRAFLPRLVPPVWPLYFIAEVQDCLREESLKKAIKTSHYLWEHIYEVQNDYFSF